MGIVLVVIGLLCVLVSRGSYVFYILYTLQTFSLLSFIEIGWVNPLSYVMQSLQYLMIFNVIGRVWKSESIDFKKLSYYRLNNYYH